MAIEKGVQSKQTRLSRRGRLGTPRSEDVNETAPADCSGARLDQSL